MKKEKLKRIARRITAFAAAAAMAATLAFPTGTELLGINFGMSVVASAETMTDGNFDYTVNESTVTITKYNGYGGEVEIPATIGGNTVTSIGAEAFKDCTSLTSVAIPGGVYSIGVEAFKGCSNLRSITIPGSVTSIGGYAFHSCTSLESINIPDSVTKIDTYTFTNCTSLSEITIPKNVTSIANSAFMLCSGLSSINVAEGNTKYISDDGVLFNKNKTELLFYPANKDGTSYAIPDGVTTIESNAFYENNNLVSITIPDGVTYIGAGAFDSCKKLTSVSIPASVNSIGTEAFNSCESLTAISVHENNSVYSSENGVLFDKNKTILFVYPAEKSEKSYTVPDTVQQIYMSSFAGCVNLENITLNEGVEKIYSAAFTGCTSLKTINIPSSVTALGDQAFMLCTSLKTINIPSSVTAIGDQAFMGCTSLTEISVHADNSNYSSEDGVLFDKNKTTLIVYPGGKSDTSYSVPSSVTSVYSMAFLMCPNLESIAFPPSVTSFGYSLIFGCEKLASVFVLESAAFTNQIDPAKMFTSEVRYAVSDDKANITGIELGTGQTTVDIPETICGYTVASVLPSQWAKVGKHTHKWDGTNTCGLCGVNRASVFDITIAEPTAGEALATQATVICNTGEENCDITWEPSSADGKASYCTAYTANVKITSGSTPVVTINGEAVDSSNITANVDGTFTVKHTFDATEKRTLTASNFSFAAPSDLVYNGSAKEAAFTTAVSGAGDITVKYYDDNGTKLDSAPVNAGTYTVKIDVAAGAECAAANELTDSTWTFTIKRATPTITVTASPTSDIAGKTITVTAQAENPDNSTLTDVPTPTLTYKVGESGTATAFTGSFVIPEGTPIGTVITVTAATAENENYYAETATAEVIVSDCEHTDVPTEWEKDETDHWHICNYCGAVVDKAEHTYGSWKITVPATADANGKKERSCTVCGYVQEGVVTYGGDESTGNTQNSTDPENNACHAELDLTDEEIISKIPLTPEELEAIENGADLEVYMVVIDYSGKVPVEDKSLAEAVLAGEMQIGMYIDVSLFVKVGDNEPRAVTNTNGDLKISFEMPEKLINTEKNVTREYSIIRVHSGVATVLDCEFDNATNKGSFVTDKFSSYAIAYKDIEEEEPAPEPEKTVYYPVITSGNVVADKSYAAAGQTVNVIAGFGYDIIVTAANGRQIAKITDKGSFTMPASKVYVKAVQNETFALMATAWNQSYVYSYDADMNKIKVNSTKKRGVIVIDLGEEYADRTFTIYSGRKSTKVKVTEGEFDENGKFVFEVPDGKNYTLVVED
ncbi:leucine-rich repeat domain-containing protein [Huintestinicola sp.]|uniref:leucine-rich repeat domain-containing protein n=1 Tax=Huintestinicola sp. TaxID=2981661 RepID=UPI003D7EFD27